MNGKLLHWLVGVLITLMVALGGFTVQLYGSIIEHRTLDTHVQTRLQHMDDKLDRVLNVVGQQCRVN